MVAPSCLPDHVPDTAAPGAPDHLRSSRDIAAVLRGRRQRAGRLAVVYLRAADHDGPARLAVVASRKVGTAVARNRAKRLLREAARHLHWAPGHDVVLVARRACAASTFAEVHAELATLGAELDLIPPLRDAS